MITIEKGITAEEYNEIRKNIGWKEYDPKRVKSALEQTKYIVKACNREKTIGMARAISDGLYVTILDVAVKKEYQKQGIGTIIIKELFNQIKNDLKENEKIVIFLLAENKQVEEFYTKLGFEKTPNMEVGSGMIKLLKG